MIKFSKHGSRRRFAEEFKKQRIREYEKGEITVSEISKQYKVSVNSVYKWIKKYSYFYEKCIVVVEEKDSNTRKLKEAEKRIKDLEQLLGKKQILVEYLEELIKVAGQHYDSDLKKTLSTKHSSGLE